MLFIMLSLFVFHYVNTMEMEHLSSNNLIQITLNTYQEYYNRSKEYFTENKVYFYDPIEMENKIKSFDLNDPLINYCNQISDLTLDIIPKYSPPLKNSEEYIENCYDAFKKLAKLNCTTFDKNSMIYYFKLLVWTMHNNNDEQAKKNVYNNFLTLAEKILMHYKKDLTLFNKLNIFSGTTITTTFFIPVVYMVFSQFNFLPLEIFFSLLGITSTTVSTGAYLYYNTNYTNCVKKIEELKHNNSNEEINILID
ncbi:hypothetical protein EKK58_02635 [Candidatus Dependentiae bacterium]|nr:MAG: hypothetical protein EKK58_02635 [Candidatus Dependentiae bacterium]